MLREYQQNLINDLYKSLRSGKRKPCLVLPCGGGKSVICAELAKAATNKKKRVLFIVHRRELIEQIKATFDDFDIDTAFCSVEMVQTVTRQIDKIKEPSVIITDECHHSLAKSYKDIYKAFPNAFCIGVTATPTRLNGEGLKGVYDDLIQGVTAKWLIENGYLARYRYYSTPIIDVKQVKITNGEFKMDNEHFTPKIYGDIVQNYIDLSNRKKAILYAPTVEVSRKFAEEFNRKGIKASHIDGTTSKEKREKSIKDFRTGEILILCNNEILGEGFNVPDCETVILCRPTASLSLFIQQSMRCMRPNNDKVATIIDHVGNIYRHGQPDMSRDWTLEGKKKLPRKNNFSSVHTCENCYFVWEGKQKTCPDCGYKAETEEKNEIEHDSTVELQEIELNKIDSYKDINQCETRAEAFLWAKAKGYKPGYVYHNYRTNQRLRQFQIGGGKI